MSVKINTAIGPRAFELIRDRIGEILAVELPSQATLNNTDYLNADVYVERFRTVEDQELPVVIVRSIQNNYDSQVISKKDGTYLIIIDVYQKAPSTSATDGDEQATKRQQRLLGVISGVLSDSVYRTLGFEAPFIEHTEVKSIIFSYHDSTEASNVSKGRLEFIVRAPEITTKLTPTLINGYETTITLYETEYGYKFGLNDSVPPSTITGLTIENE